MKTKFFLTALIATFMALPVSAGVTPNESTSVEYLHNHGHSDTMIEMVQKSKAIANGEEYQTPEQKQLEEDFVLVRWVKKFFMYLDPAQDNGSFMDHNIKMTPQVNDL